MGQSNISPKLTSSILAQPASMPIKPWRSRWYFPKGTDLNLITYDHLKFVAAEMNGRPRKVLGWKTPAEVYAEAVAMTG